MLRLMLAATSCCFALSILGCNQSPPTPPATQSPEFPEDRDSQLCYETCKRVLNHFGRDLKSDEIPPSFRTVLLVWNSTGIIDNGGFDYLFEGDFAGDPRFLMTAKSFEEIGSVAATEAFREAFELFPDGEMQTNLEERQEYYAAIPEDRRMEINRKFWSVNHEISGKLADYIRSRASEFETLKPLPRD